MLGWTERDFDVTEQEVDEANDDLIRMWLLDTLGQRKELFPEKYRRITGKEPPRTEVGYGTQVPERQPGQPIQYP